MLRPVSFSIPSSTELQISFNLELNELVGIENFEVQSVSGNVDGLRILGTTLNGKVVTVRTSPQISGNYYVLKLKDTGDVPFSSDKGIPLINDDVSRDLYFVGLKNENPTRDRMVSKIPKTYNLENSNVNNIVNSQADEIYQAQKHIGEVLSDNYISVRVEDEYRVRSSGATDRLANENVFLLEKISPVITGSNLVFNSIDYNDSFTGERHSSIPKYLISLKEKFVDREEISLSTEGNSFKGFLISLKNKNVIKLLSLEIVKTSDVPNCDNEIGTIYNIQKYKYSIKNNEYDPEFSLNLPILENNQILLSEFGNIEQPMVGDTIYVSYLYKDNGILINESSLEVYNLKDILTESVPTNTTKFFLDNAPIVNQDNLVPSLGGVSFYKNENSTELASQFKKELVFNSSKLPNNLGEYAVNYSTGEVIVVGENYIGEGTGNLSVIASYTYRNTYTKNLDYYFKDGDFSASQNRSLIGEKVKIDFNYEKIYVDGEDYRAPCHVEVMNEHVANNFASSFVIRPQKTPVTNVFRIFNQTTNEVYTPLYSTRDEIYFSGNRSPEFRNKQNEVATFSRIELENLEPFSEFICPAFTVKITANASNNSIQFTPGIPSEFININSQDYFIRSKGLSGIDIIDDLQIRFFNLPDTNGLINQVSISPTATPPDIGEEVTIGTRGAAFYLNKNLILNNLHDSIGDFSSSSVSFSRLDLFVKEKYFKNQILNPGFLRVNNSTLNSDILSSKNDDFYKNLSRLRNVGEYSIDYSNGIVYLALPSSYEYNFGTVDYYHGEIKANNSNIIATIEASRKESSADTVETSNIIYNSISNNVDTIKILDLDQTILVSDNTTTAFDLNNQLQNICEILDDYTVVVPYDIVGLNSIFDIKNIEGSNVYSNSSASRIKEVASDLVNLPVYLGGANIYDPKYLSYSRNVIDLKRSVTKRLAQSGNYYTLEINDPYFSSLYSVIHTPSGNEIFSDNLNITKIPLLEAVNSTILGGNIVVDIVTSPEFYKIDTSEDYLLDSNNNRFLILSKDSTLSQLTLQSPSENNPSVVEPELGNVSIIVKALTTYINDTFSIQIPVDSDYNPKDPITVKYLQNFIPPVGTKLAIGASFGSVYVSYTYCYDDVYVYYEYGDNEVDWSISNTLSSGDEYYATYRFGALRNALRKNFGILTKIPFFVNFGLDTNREVYRDAISGTLQAFTKGPTIPAFKELISSFTDIEPNITESFFGSWILGRDYINPAEISVKGSLDFVSSKFAEGISIKDDTVVSFPAISNLNLNEGTISSWIQPEWRGINNDATIYVSLDNIGNKSYSYKLGSNIFNKENDFNVLISDDSIGGHDYSAPNISLHNFDISWLNQATRTEKLETGVFALAKEESGLTRVCKSQHSIGLKVNYFEPTDLWNILFSDGYVDGYGSETLLSNYNRIFSPAAISIGDKNKLIFLLLSLIPVVDENNEPLIIDIISQDIEKQNLPQYDRAYQTGKCSCVIDTNIVPFLSFRDELYQSIKISLNKEINISYSKNIKNTLIDLHPSTLRIIDQNNYVFKVIGFEDQFGEVLTDIIPDIITKIIVANIPENNQWLSSKGSSVINSIIPSGRLTLVWQTTGLITESSNDSQAYLYYSNNPLITDWISGPINIDINRSPLDNNVSIDISTYNNNVANLNVFYTDLLNSSSEDIIKENLNISNLYLDGGNTKYLDIDNINSISNKFLVGILDKSGKSSISITSLSYNFDNRFSTQDIYIGTTARNPRKNPFQVNKLDFPATSIGIPHNADTAEGIFIGFDELCTSQLSSDSGQWVFRSRANKSVEVPISVIPSNGSYIFEYGLVAIDHNFSGTLLTEGEFSSVTRARRLEDGSGCPTGIVCSEELRYCGNGLLEQSGWVRLNESDSNIINAIIGGYEADRVVWNKWGSFNTSSSTGIYRMGPSTGSEFSPVKPKDFGNFVYTLMPCTSGDYSVTVSFKVSQNDSNIIGSNVGQFFGQISGNLTGIVPIHILDNEYNLKISLAFAEDGSPLILIINQHSDEILDIVYYNWNNQIFNEITLAKDISNNIFEIRSSNAILSRLNFAEITKDSIDTCSTFNVPTVACYLFDGSLVDVDTFYQQFYGNILDISLISYSARYEEGINRLESNDILVNTDSKIDFSFNITGNLPVDPDPYDGYQPNIENDVDEIYFTSDRFRYLFDTGESSAKNRISIFKDGKGFLNFRIFDQETKDTNIYNIAANIKTFKPGELHHVAASWKLNSLIEKDEMHLFIDGLEVPNIFKFGGLVKTKINDKFSDISKETLQDFLTPNVIYSNTFNDGVTLAGDIYFTSNQAQFNQSMIGRSVIITSSTLANSYVGKELIISSVVGNKVAFVTGSNLDSVTFNVSASNIQFKFPPTAGINNNIITDLRNEKFSIFKTDCNNITEEMGGILYSVNSGTINILNTKNIINPKFRVNVDSRVVEFIGRNTECLYEETVDFSDLNIFIQTYGLKFENCKDTIELTSSSYNIKDNILFNPFSGKSTILANAAEPVSLKDVEIKRIVMPKTIPTADTILDYNGYNLVDFEILLNDVSGKHILTSESGLVNKTNLGRYLTISFDSDNAIFCQDGYIDGYSQSPNEIVIHGITTDGVNLETIVIDKNGKFNTTKLFKSVIKITGSILVADSDYEICVIELTEKDAITIPNNNGEYAEVYQWSNGTFILTNAGSNGFYPFELHPGFYSINYPAYLRIKIPNVGNSAYIGCDINSKNQFGGIIDEFRIITEMSNDTRPTEVDTTGTNSITEQYTNPNPTCPDDQTLILIHFDDPLQFQSRRLRQKVFLNTDNNSKFNLTAQERSDLLRYINNKEKFISKMIRMGFAKSIAEETYIECHHANGGPLFNEARYTQTSKMLVSAKSVNNNFGNSAIFNNTNPLLIENSFSYFRKNEGTIEFWISPIVDTIFDKKERCYIDIFSVTKKRIKSSSPSKIVLPTTAKQIMSIKLLKKTQEYSEFYTKDEENSIIFDEINSDQITGRLQGGTGTDKDFAVGGILESDGKTIKLNDNLPGSFVDVVVTYIPVDSSGDRVLITKDKESNIVFSITASGKTSILTKKVDWKKNTWHRISCMYKTNSTSDSMRLFVDGSENGQILYGDPSLVYGSGYLYGQIGNQSGQSQKINYNIKLTDEFNYISIGSDMFQDISAMARIDNLRFSRGMRLISKDPSGQYIDTNYSSNTNTVRPVVFDDLTTLILNFESNNSDTNYVTVVDPYRGIFDFDIDIYDNFNKINNEETEDLIVELVNKLKPAHSNALVKFPRDPCPITNTNNIAITTDPKFDINSKPIEKFEESFNYE